NIFLVSDSSGETVLTVANSVLAQFQGIKVNKYLWPMVRTIEELEKLLDEVIEKRGVIIYTIAERELRHKMKEVCDAHEIPFIGALGSVITCLEGYLGSKASNIITGAKHVDLGQSYYDRIEAINFTINHDDGQSLQTMNAADIVLVGLSRSSKTPTSLYLAQRGYKVANLPFIKNIGIRVKPEDIKAPLVVGLVISPERLKQIRASRLEVMNSGHFNEDYIDIRSINAEAAELRRLFSETDWPVIDVTGKAIEETSADIIKLHNKKIGGNKRLG
ncbi:UNVERIFIED_CONTAM: hypothetical protein GTU68_027525, partial [Idotea baltica]|nr:hypothetical protein [Idotea baltica]